MVMRSNWWVPLSARSLMSRRSGVGRLTTFFGVRGWAIGVDGGRGGRLLRERSGMYCSPSIVRRSFWSFIFLISSWQIR